jgi:PAT family beta-lactamase induction signal transducer AmpG
MTTSQKLRWVSLLYFVQGMPFGIFADTLPVYLRLHGVSLRDIGAISLLQLPWTFKVLWSPWVDRLGTARRWSVGALMLLSGVMVYLGLIEQQGHLRWGVPLALALLVLTTASATQDIAIDGYFVRLMGHGEEGLGNGLRVGAFRAAMVVGGGGTVMLAGLLPWHQVFYVAAAGFATLAICMGRLPSLTPAQSQPWQAWGQSLWQWLRHPGALGAFAFVLLYKLGDASMAAMIKPFWVDRGMRATQIGLWNTTFGIGAAVAGALIGGWYTSRAGIFRALWVLGLAQACSNLGYAAVAALQASNLFLYATSLSESFTGGLGTAAELALLTRLCDRDHAATQFAALTALFGLTRALAGTASGFGVESWGFASYFAFTFLLAFPAYAFLPAVRRRLQA